MSKPPPKVGRRELLKLAPVLALGAFAVPAGAMGCSSAASASATGWRTSRSAAGTSRPHLRGRRRGRLREVPLQRLRRDRAGHRLRQLDAHRRRRGQPAGGLQARADPGAAEGAAEHPPRLRRGWDAIGRFAGARLADFLDRVGADPGARFVTVECADDYYESLDMASARHPQTLLCYEMYDRPLDRGHGAPLRLQIPTKLGYKQAKYLTSLNVTHVLGARRSYWGDQGYSWYGGL